MPSQLVQLHQGKLKALNKCNTIMYTEMENVISNLTKANM